MQPGGFVEADLGRLDLADQVGGGLGIELGQLGGEIEGFLGLHALFVVLDLGVVDGCFVGLAAGREEEGEGQADRAEDSPAR